MTDSRRSVRWFSSADSQQQGDEEMRQGVIHKFVGKGTVTAGLLAFLAICVLLAPRATTTAVADPPENQTYTGAKRCASCHFEQYMSWNKTAHAKAFTLLTAKYESNAECLKCHTTGYGEPSGFKDKASTAALAGITCESCHGPGSEHEKISQQFAKVKTLTAEQEEQVRGSIWLMLPQNVCVECHTVQGHGESQTPAELRKQ
jgi:mono/diheme cytochrome c family protein